MLADAMGQSSQLQVVWEIYQGRLQQRRSMKGMGERRGNIERVAAMTMVGRAWLFR